MANGWTREDAIDWEKVNTDAPPPPEPGIYKVLFEKAEPAEMGKDKNPGIKLELKGIEAFGKGELERPIKLFDNLVLTQAAFFKTKQAAKAANVELPPTLRYADVEEFCGRLVEASHAYVRLKHETYEGKVRARVDRYLNDEEAAEAANAGSGKSEPAAEERPVRRKRSAS